MFPYLLIAVGLAVLAFGTRLSVLGAAVGAIFGVALLRLLPGEQGFWPALLITGGLAVFFVFGANLAKGAVNSLTLILGVIAGAAIALNVLDLFGISFGLLDWALVVVGGCIGAVLVTGFKGWAVIMLAGLVGAVLTLRGLGILLPGLHGLLATMLTLLLAGAAIAYHSGMFDRRRPQLR